MKMIENENDNIIVKEEPMENENENVLGNYYNIVVKEEQIENVKVKEEEKEENKKEENKKEKEENVVLVNEFEGKRIRKSHLDTKTGLLYNQSGISYYSKYNPYKENKEIVHKYKIKKVDLFQLMEQEILQFPLKEEMNFESCKNNITNWSANICRMVNRQKSDASYKFIFEENVTFVEEEKEEEIEINVNIAKNVTFQIIYFEVKEGKKKIMLCRDISFKSKRALGRDYPTESKRKRELRQQKVLNQLPINEKEESKTEENQIKDFTDFGDDDDDTKNEEYNTIKFNDDFMNSIKRIKLETFDQEEPQF